MKGYAIIAGVVAAAVIITLWAVTVRVARAPGPQACTLEAKLCPDGSYVGRTGPECEFAACPSGGPVTLESRNRTGVKIKDSEYVFSFEVAKR